MDDTQFAPFLKYSPADAAPDTPNLMLSLELQGLSGSEIAKRNSNSRLVFRIHRGNDGHDQPCSFYWSATVDAWGSGGLVLLRHNVDSQLEVPSEPWRARDSTEPRISRHTQGLFELKPGESTWFFAGIPESWLDTMVAGEKYELLWPGEIYWWRWGSVEKNESRSRDGLPLAVLSGTPRVSFTVVEKPPAPGYETPEPKWPRAPAPGTPMLIVTLTGAESKAMTDERFQLVQTVTYQGLVSKDPDADSEPATQPIMFDAFQLLIPSERIFRSRGNSEWEYCEDPSVGCAMSDLIYDFEAAVNISEDRRWISLAPGESWSQNLGIDDQRLSDQAPGDKIRYQLEGGIIEMWNWGSREDHAQTELMLPSGRDAGEWIDGPPIVMPASNPLEFTIVS